MNAYKEKSSQASTRNEQLKQSNSTQNIDPFSLNLKQTYKRIFCRRTFLSKSTRGIQTRLQEQALVQTKTFYKDLRWRCVVHKQEFLHQNRIHETNG